MSELTTVEQMADVLQYEAHEFVRKDSSSYWGNTYYYDFIFRNTSSYQVVGDVNVAPGETGTKTTYFIESQVGTVTVPLNYQLQVTTDDGVWTSATQRKEVYAAINKHPSS